MNGFRMEVMSEMGPERTDSPEPIVSSIGWISTLTVGLGRSLQQDRKRSVVKNDKVAWEYNR